MVWAARPLRLRHLLAGARLLLPPQSFANRARGVRRCLLGFMVALTLVGGTVFLGRRMREKEAWQHMLQVMRPTRCRLQPLPTARRSMRFSLPAAMVSEVVRSG